MRDVSEIGAWAARDINDFGTSTIIFVGRDGSKTELHMDRACAKNIAFGADWLGEGEVLAEWLFVLPQHLQSLLQWADAAETQDAKHVTLTHNIKVSDDLPDKLVSRSYITDAGVKALLSHPDRHNWVKIVQQRHGEMVQVPVGWAHQVTNRKPCLKVAWDCYDPADLGTVFQLTSWLRNLGRLNLFVQDYLTVEVAAINLLEGFFLPRTPVAKFKRKCN